MTTKKEPPKKSNRGRKTKLNRPLIKAFCANLKDNMPITTCCSMVNITKPTYYEWIERGKKGNDDLYQEFTYSVMMALGSAEKKLVKSLLKDSPWQAKAWILKNRHGENWKDKQTIESVDNDLERKIEAEEKITKSTVETLLKEFHGDF